MIKAAIFDMDGLLIDSEPLWREAEIKEFEQVGIQLCETDCKETMGMRINEVVEYWFDQQPWQGVTKHELAKKIVDAMDEQIRSRGQAMPGCIEVLDICKAQGLKIGLASSSYMKLIRSTLSTLGIAHYFDSIHSAQDEPFGKPHPAVFIHTASDLGVKPEECVIFEDSFHGVIAGLSARSKVVAVPDQNEFEQERFRAASLVIPSLKQFSEQMLHSL